MGKLENRLRETISDLQEKHNEIVELGEEKLRERDEYLAPLIGRLEEIDRIPDLTLTKYSVLDGSSVDDIMDKHGVFLRQLHRLGSTSGVYFHLLYYFDPDERIPKGHHLSVVFYATSRDRRKLEGISLDGSLHREQAFAHRRLYWSIV